MAAPASIHPDACRPGHCHVRSVVVVFHSWRRCPRQNIAVLCCGTAPGRPASMGPGSAPQHGATSPARGAGGTAGEGCRHELAAGAAAAVPLPCPSAAPSSAPGHSRPHQPRVKGNCRLEVGAGSLTNGSKCGSPQLPCSLQASDSLNSAFFFGIFQLLSQLQPFAGGLSCFPAAVQPRAAPH